MSQVNFVQQINLFMEFGRRNGLTSYERMFWLGLFHVANTWAQRSPNHEWPDDFFPVSNSEIAAWSGLEERNIRTIRNRFKQIGLVDFKKGDGRKSDPEYRIFYLRYIGYKIVPDTQGNGDRIAPDCVGDSVGDCVPDCVGDTAPGTVPDLPPTRCKNAPDCVCDPLSSSSNPDVFNININQGTVKAGAETRENAGEPLRGRARAAAIVDQMRQRQRGGFGLVDLDSDFTGTEGLVPLPWDEGRR